uniref:A to I editase domain-containing protein n=1 Tax=Acanthochromis polyacanthus TaxID=80966 RepID=A0A3Q1GSJ3_9TELE
MCFTGISNAEARQPGKAPNFSVNWTVGDQGLEVINATTGKDDLCRPSRLCKHALYSRWMRLHCKAENCACLLKMQLFIIMPQKHANNQNQIWLRSA